MKDFKKFRENLGEEVETVEEGLGVALPPNILILRRQSIRHFPGQTLVALYYNDKLDQYFSIPFGGEDNLITPTSMKEETEQLDELKSSTLTSYIDKRGEQVRKSVDSGDKKAKITHFRGLGKAATKLSYKAASVKEETEQLDEVNLGKKDHEVIKAFLNKKPHESKKLSTDGKRLDGNWMGGRGIAHHKDVGHRTDVSSVEYNDIGSKSAQQVHRAVRRHHNLQEEETLQEDAITHLRSVKEFHTNKSLKHKDGTQTRVDPTTAHALLTVHDALSDEHKVKFKDQLEKSKGHFHRMVDFAWKNVK